MLEQVAEYRRGDFRLLVGEAESPIYPPVGWDIYHEAVVARPDRTTTYFSVFWRRARTRYEPTPTLRSITEGKLVVAALAWRGVGSPPIVAHL